MRIKASIFLLMVFLSQVCVGEENIMMCENRGVPYIGEEVGLPDVIIIGPDGELSREGSDPIPGQVGGLTPEGKIRVKAGVVEVESGGNGRAVSHVPGDGLVISIIEDAASGLLTIIRGAVTAVAAKTPAPWRKDPAVPPAGKRGGKKSCNKPNAECGDGSALNGLLSLKCDPGKICNHDTCKCQEDVRCTDPLSNCEMRPGMPDIGGPCEGRCSPTLGNPKLCTCSGPMAQASFDSEDFLPAEEIDEDGGSERAVSGGSTPALERGGFDGTWYQVYDYPGAYIEVSPDNKYVSWYVWGIWQLYERTVAGEFRLIQESDHGGQVTRYEWANGKLVRKDFPGGRVEFVYGTRKLSVNYYSCDLKHESCEVQSWKGQENDFNQFGQITKARSDYLPGYVEVTGSSVSAVKNDGVEYRYEYDNVGRLFEVYVKRGAKELLVVRYTYDNLGRLSQTTDTIGRTVDYSYPSSREVVATSNQSVSRYSFDTENRIIDFWSQAHPSEPYSRVNIEYAGPGCDKLVYKYKVDDGSGTLVTAEINDWSTDENRRLRSETYAPDGTPIVTTYNEYTDKIDRNQPQEITVEGLGTSKVEYSFKPAKDKLDARLLVDSVKTTSIPVTDLDGKKSVVESFIKYTDFGRPLYTKAEGLVTAYEYDDRHLISRVLSGPESGTEGEPDMADPTSYAVSVERDRKTGEILKYNGGSAAAPLITTSKYEKGALVERSYPGGGKTTYRYNWFGDVAVEEVLALDDKGQPFAPGARTKYTNLMQTDEYGRVKALYSDIGDPTKNIAEYSSVTYERDSEGRVTRIVPSVGESIWFGYVGSILKEKRIGGPNGDLLQSVSSTPNSVTVRELLGKSNGQLNYVDVVSRFNQYGDLIEKESVQFNRKAAFGYDRFGRVVGTKLFIGSQLVSESRVKLDEFGRTIEGHRINPRTQAVDVVSRVKYAGNRLAATYDIFGNPTVYNYVQGGALKRVNSNTEEILYDYLPGAGVVSKVTQKTKDLTSIVSYKYSNGRVSEEQYLGKGATQPLVRRFSYDTLGRVLGVTDYTGRTYRQIVGPDGFLWSSKTDELQIAWKRAIDSATGQVTVQRFVNNEPPTTQIFNKYGLIKHIDFDGKTTEVTYNSVGDRESIRYPDGMIAGVSRDNKNRVTQVSVPDATGVTNWVVGFDNQDLVNKVTKTRGSQVSEIEALNRGDFGEVTKIAWRENGRAPVIASFNYKAPNGITIPGLSFGGEIGGVSINKDIDLKTGELKSLKYAGNIVPGGEVEFKMDGNNTLQYPASTNLRSDWKYDEFGMLKRVVVSQNNQILHGAEYTYNSSMQTAKVEKVDGDGYAYEYQGSRLVKATNLNTNKTTEIAYDPKYPQRRIKMIRADGSVVNYQYDKIGRLVALDVGGAVHQLSYDVLGRVTEIKIIGGDTWNYIYDTNGYNPKPAEVKKNGVSARTFEYDLNGNLKSTSANGQQKHYLNVGTGRFGAVNPATGLLSEVNVNFPGIPTEIIATLKGAQSNYFTHDHQYTTERAFDNNGSLVEQYETNLAEEDFKILTAAGAQINSSAIGYDAGFHNLRAFADAAPSTLGALIFTTHRVAVTLLGFLSEDSLDVAAYRTSMHMNNPADISDPTGLQGSADTNASLTEQRHYNESLREAAATEKPATPEELNSGFGGAWRRLGDGIEAQFRGWFLGEGGEKFIGRTGMEIEVPTRGEIYFNNTIGILGPWQMYKGTEQVAALIVMPPEKRNDFIVRKAEDIVYVELPLLLLPGPKFAKSAPANMIDVFPPLNTKALGTLPGALVGEPLAFHPIAPMRSANGGLWVVDDFLTTPAARRAPVAMEGAAARDLVVPGKESLKSRCSNWCGDKDMEIRIQVGRQLVEEGLIAEMTDDLFRALPQLEGVRLTPGDLRKSSVIPDSPHNRPEPPRQRAILFEHPNGTDLTFNVDCDTGYITLYDRYSFERQTPAYIDLTGVEVFLVPEGGGKVIFGELPYILETEMGATRAIMLNFPGIDFAGTYNVFVRPRSQPSRQYWRK